VSERELLELVGWGGNRLVHGLDARDGEDSSMLEVSLHRLCKYLNINIDMSR
jgi:hypothetical protein